mmetsp:Transcript_2640/g.6326  ORF Transcript_2640/g.6326 Transcript_2640/m.6326 type:complete len:105 (+) Transcript_2640:976-1290(+)
MPEILSLFEQQPNRDIARAAHVMVCLFAGVLYATSPEPGDDAPGSQQDETGQRNGHILVQCVRDIDDPANNSHQHRSRQAWSCITKKSKLEICLRFLLPKISSN